MHIKLNHYNKQANVYYSNRPGYSVDILKEIIALTNEEKDQLCILDLGAGTGKISEQLVEIGCKNILAVEPHEEMRNFGSNMTPKNKVSWLPCYAENIDIEDQSCDLIVAGSSFHLVDFNLALLEASRVLKNTGQLVLIWNPKVIHSHFLLQKAEAVLAKISETRIKQLDINKKSFITSLVSRIEQHGLFQHVKYLEKENMVNITANQFIQMWQVTHNLKERIGTKNFRIFIAELEGISKQIKDPIEIAYLTKAWIFRKV